MVPAVVRKKEKPGRKYALQLSIKLNINYNYDILEELYVSKINTSQLFL